MDCPIRHRLGRLDSGLGRLGGDHAQICSDRRRLNPARVRALPGRRVRKWFRRVRFGSDGSAAKGDHHGVRNECSPGCRINRRWFASVRRRHPVLRGHVGVPLPGCRCRSWGGPSGSAVRGWGCGQVCRRTCAIGCRPGSRPVRGPFGNASRARRGPLPRPRPSWRAMMSRGSVRRSVAAALNSYRHRRQPRCGSTGTSPTPTSRTVAKGSSRNPTAATQPGRRAACRRRSADGDRPGSGESSSVPGLILRRRIPKQPVFRSGGVFGGAGPCRGVAQSPARAS